MAADEGYTPARKRFMSVTVSEEDCPSRARFLDDLAIRKGRKPSNWREVLGQKDADPKSAHQG